MPFQIKPREYLPIVRQLSDPTDTNTYYLRAYVYKQKGGTEELLATLDMNDQGSQRFTYHYQVPADSSGEGYYLSIVTKVYDDSGYTSLNSLYYIEEKTYLVAERWGLQYGSGGGADVDYKKIRRMIQEEIGKVPQPAKPPQPQKIDLNPVLREVQEVQKNISKIKIPQPEKVDLKPIREAVEKTRKEIQDIRIPEPEEVDLNPVLEAIQENRRERKEEIEKMEKDLDGLSNKFQDTELGQQVKDIYAKMRNIRDLLENMSDLIENLQKKEEKSRNSQKPQRFI